MSLLILRSRKDSIGPRPLASSRGSLVSSAVPQVRFCTGDSGTPFCVGAEYPGSPDPGPWQTQPTNPSASEPPNPDTQRIGFLRSKREIHSSQSPIAAFRGCPHPHPYPTPLHPPRAGSHTPRRTLEGICHCEPARGDK